jgi:hypothetical protein
VTDAGPAPAALTDAGPRDARPRDGWPGGVVFADGARAGDPVGTACPLASGAMRRVPIATARPATLLVGPLLAAVLLTAACGGTSGPASPPPSGDGPPTTIPTQAPPAATSGRPVPVPDPLVAQPPAGGTTVPADRVDATGLPVGFPALVWTLGPRTLGVYGRAGGCTEVRAELVEQTPEQVAVRVVQVSTGPGPCTRELRYPPLEVPLDADLGERRVVLTGTAV